jgi:hypothetical protein
MKIVRLAESTDTPTGVRAFLWDGKKETELGLITFSEGALLRLTDVRFRRRPPKPPETMKEGDFGEPSFVSKTPGLDKMFPRRSEDSKLFFGE